MGRARARGGRIVTGLAGARVVLTRSSEDCTAWAERLRQDGADAVPYPCIETELFDSSEVRARLRAALEAADWLITTSRRGVDAVTALYGATLPARLKVGAVGETTGQAARTQLGRVDLVGAGTAAVLGRTLASELAGRPHARVVLALAENARRALERELEAVAAEVVRVDVYRTRPAPEAQPKQSLAALGADAVWLASPSAVEGFCHRTEIDAAPALISIGPSTSEALRAHGLDIAAEAARASFEGLREATRCRIMQ